MTDTAVTAPPVVSRRIPSRATGLDVAAFITALLPIPFVGAVLGMVGIGEAHKDGRNAHGLSIAATIIGWAWTILLVIGILITTLAVATVHSQSPAQQFNNCIQNAIVNGTPAANCQ
jgi:hypothetical protein